MRGVEAWRCGNNPAAWVKVRLIRLLEGHCKVSEGRGRAAGLGREGSGCGHGSSERTSRRSLLKSQVAAAGCTFIGTLTGIHGSISRQACLSRGGRITEKLDPRLQTHRRLGCSSLGLRVMTQTKVKKKRRRKKGKKTSLGPHACALFPVCVPFLGRAW